MLSLSDANESLSDPSPAPCFGYQNTPLRVKYQAKPFPCLCFMLKAPLLRQITIGKINSVVFGEYTLTVSPPQLRQSRSQLQGSLLR